MRLFIGLPLSPEGRKQAADYMTALRKAGVKGTFTRPENLHVTLAFLGEQENTEAAEAYITFLCRPDVCGENLEYLGYSVPIDGATDYMDPEAVSNPIAYPDEETLAKGVAFLNLPAETSQLMDSLWLKVKTSGGNKTLIIGIIGLAVVIAVCAIFIIRRKKKKARRKSLYTK